MADYWKNTMDPYVPIVADLNPGPRRALAQGQP